MKAITTRGSVRLVSDVTIPVIGLWKPRILPVLGKFIAVLVQLQGKA